MNSWHTTRRITHYLRKALDTGTVERLPFTREHYASAGLPYSPAIGMPILEAHQLVNHWNVSQDQQRTMYALE